MSPAIALRHPIVILSWNLCHFAAFTDTLDHLKSKGENLSQREQEWLRKHVKATLQRLEMLEEPDMMIFQELPVSKRAERIQTLLGCLEKDKYEHAEDTSLEHLFVWRKDTIYTKRHMDHPRTLFRHGLVRPVASMQFYTIEEHFRFIVSSVHLKSGGKAETQREFQHIMKEYPAATKVYFSETQPNTLQILAGDFNLNPHAQTDQTWREQWETSGNSFTKTSSGGQGYDFFMIYKPSTGIHQVGLYQKEFVQPIIKNASQGQIGISDHDPILLTLYPYRASPFELASDDTQT